MLPSVLLVAGLLLGPACCAAPPTAAAASVSAGTSPPQQTATPTAETSPPQQTLAPTAETSPPQQPAAPTAATAGASLPTAETPADVTLDQVVAELSGLYQATAHAATAEPLAQLAKALSGIQATMTAMSGRLDLFHDSRIQQQKVLTSLARRLDTMEEVQTEASSRLDTLQLQQQKAQGDLARRLGAIEEVQTEASGQLRTIQLQQQKAQDELLRRLDVIREVQTEVSSRFDIVQSQQQKAQEDQARKLDTLKEVQTEASSRLDTLQLQQQKAQTDLARRLGAIKEVQIEASNRLDIMRSTLSTVQEAQSELSRALLARFGAVEASQGNLSSRVDALLQQQQRAAEAAVSEPADIQRQLDAIQTAVDLIPKTVLGRTCSSDTDCSHSLPEAECGGGGRCSCRDGYRQVLDTECRRHSRLSEVCLEDADCQTLASNATCSSGTCGCVSGFWNHDNEECRRVSAVSKGGACVDDQDCVSGRHLQCVSGACSCHTKTVGDYEYRLVGGRDCTEGNVQLRRTGGSWGRVCDDGWGSNDANVICRSLGFTSGSSTIKSNFGRGTSFYMDDVNCNGSESHLMLCSFLGWRKHNCGAGEVAGARCS